MAKTLKLFILSDALRGAYLTFSAYLKFFIKSKGGWKSGLPEQGKSTETKKSHSLDKRSKKKKNQPTTYSKANHNQMKRKKASYFCICKA